MLIGSKLYHLVCSQPGLCEGLMTAKETSDVRLFADFFLVLFGLERPQFSVYKVKKRLKKHPSTMK